MIYRADIISSIKDILVQKQETVAVAESVTGGHLQAALSGAVEAAKCFHGGITTYNLGQKTRHLNVDPILCEQNNCVAERIAQQMAIGVCTKFISHYGIAITGYASIVPECEKEGLFAWVAIAHNGVIVLSQKISSAEKEPYQVQVDYTNTVLELFNKVL